MSPNPMQLVPYDFEIYSLLPLVSDIPSEFRSSESVCAMELYAAHADKEISKTPRGITKQTQLAKGDTKRKASKG